MFNKIFVSFMSLFMALAMFLNVPGVVKINFDKIIDDIRPVHNIGRMPEYELDSEINAVFTEANMTSCRTHDINCTDIHRIFPDFSKAYTVDKCMTVNENCEWVEIPMPDKIESGSMLYITFKK